MDIVPPKTRSRMMAGIRGKNTRPEKLVRSQLFAAGYRFRLHRRDLPGAPDIVMSGRRIAIFVHGCFWHQHAGCRLAKLPTTNADFWLAKLEKNVSRDRSAVKALLGSGWRVMTVWECATRGSDMSAPLRQQLIEWINSELQCSEITNAAQIKQPPQCL